MPSIVAVALASCSYGSSDEDSGSGDGGGSADAPPEVPVSDDGPVDTSEDESPTHTSSAPGHETTPDDTTEPQGTDVGSSDDTNPPPGPSENYDALLDFNRGELRTTYGDNRSDCTQPGANLELAEPADGADVFLICAHTAEPLTGSIRLIDPLGRPWAESRMTLADRTEAFSYTDYQNPPTFDVEATAVLVEHDGALLPIGWSFLARDELVTSAYLLVPVSRPSGEWTVEFGQVTITSEYIQGCNEPGDPQSPWITGPFDFLMFAEAQAPSFDNCRFVPDLIGLPAQDAATLASKVSVGSGRVDVVPEVRCDDAATNSDFVVTHQGAQPGGLVFGARLTLDVEGRCPATDAVLGMTASDAISALNASWPAVLQPVIDTDCQDVDVVKTIETDQSEFGPFVYRLFCDGADTSTGDALRVPPTSLPDQ